MKKRAQNSFFLKPTDKNEIDNIIFTLDSNKSIGPSSITTKILKLLINDIFCQLSDIFNISFFSGMFPYILRTAKVLPIHKQDSSLD